MKEKIIGIISKEGTMNDKENKSKKWWFSIGLGITSILVAFSAFLYNAVSYVATCRPYVEMRPYAFKLIEHKPSSTAFLGALFFEIENYGDVPAYDFRVEDIKCSRSSTGVSFTLEDLWGVPEYFKKGWLSPKGKFVDKKGFTFELAPDTYNKYQKGDEAFLAEIKVNYKGPTKKWYFVGKSDYWWRIKFEYRDGTFFVKDMDGN